MTATAMDSQSYRRRHGKMHTARVDFLLKKYLGETDGAQTPPEVSTGTSPLRNLTAVSVPPAQSTTTIPVAAAATIGEKISEQKEETMPKEESIAALPAAQISLPAAVDHAPVVIKPAADFPIKKIMQVKDEQDAAIRELQHVPLPFYAKPVPLSVAMTSRMRLPSNESTLPIPSIAQTNHVAAEKSCARSSIASNNGGNSSVDRENCHLMAPMEFSSPPLTARHVPPSTSEPRYAMMMADSVLRRYSGIKDHEKIDKVETSAKNAVPVANNDGGLVRLPSWPAGGRIQEGEANALQHLRPVSARPQRSTPSQPHNNLSEIEEAPEEIEEHEEEEESEAEFGHQGFRAVVRQETQESVTEKVTEHGNDTEDDIEAEGQKEGIVEDEVGASSVYLSEFRTSARAALNSALDGKESEKPETISMRPQGFFIDIGDSEEDEE